MTRILNFDNIKQNYSLQFALAITLTLYTTGVILNNLHEIILSTLLFLILLEFVRTICDFAFSEQHIIRVVYSIDAAILFGIRELFTGWLLLKTDLFGAITIIAISTTLLFFLFILRVKSQDFKIVTSKDNEN